MLTARRHRDDKDIGGRLWAGRHRMCSTPEGITTRRTIRLPAQARIVRACSTPEGIRTTRTAGEVGHAAAWPECSTPAGITTKRTPDDSADYLGGHRVLNARRHHDDEDLYLLSYRRIDWSRVLNARRHHDDEEDRSIAAPR